MLDFEFVRNSYFDAFERFLETISSNLNPQKES
jgi:hypothetical protein